MILQHKAVRYLEDQALFSSLSKVITERQMVYLTLMTLQVDMVIHPPSFLQLKLLNFSRLIVYWRKRNIQTFQGLLDTGPEG